MILRRLSLLSRRAVSARGGQFAFVAALGMGIVLGGLAGIMGAGGVRERAAAMAAERATTVSKELDRGLSARRKLLSLLTEMPSIGTPGERSREAFSAFLATYPEFYRVGRAAKPNGKHVVPRKGPKTIKITVKGPFARVSGTLRHDWPTMLLDGREQFGTDERSFTTNLVGTDGSRVKGVAEPLASSRFIGLAEGKEGVVPWSDGEDYLTTVVPLAGVYGTSLHLQVVSGIPMSAVAAREHRYQRGGLVGGAILGLIAGVVAWVGVARSTRRLRTMNLALERRVAERTAELEAAERSFRGIFENVPLGLYQCDPQGRFLRVNPSLARTLGFLSPEATIAGLGCLQAVGDPEARASFLARLIEDGEVRESITAVTRGDGRVVWLAERARAVHGDRGEVILVEGAIHDVTAERELETQLRRLGETDPLTGLLNRRGLEEAIALAEAPVSFVALDVDRFKAFNDTYGHPAGDRALQAVAETLRRTVRGSDAVARAGGEEFVVLLPRTSEAGARRVAEALREAVEGCDAFQTGLTVSGGVATATTAEEVGDAFAAADRALYLAKEEGRNRIVVNAAKMA